MRSIEAMLLAYFIKTSFAITFSQILPSWLTPMLTKVSYSQDGSDTNYVGTPDYPSGIPDMHTIHDPMISVSWIHISELITELHHPLPYRINILTIGHMTKHDIATQGKSTTKQRIPSSIDDPRHVYYPTGNWLGDVPSSHRRHRTITIFIEFLLQGWPS
jgi:hypothetical protein